ncbi:MAG: M24 family metallopeptidase [Acidobacteriota bacterium]
MKKKELLLPIFLMFFLISHSYSQFGFRHTNIEIRDLIRKNKLNQLLIPILEENNIDCWITITRDPCDDMTNVIWERDRQLDPIAEYIGGENVKAPAAFIFTKDGNRVAVVEQGDAKYVKDTDIYRNIDEYTYNREKGHSEFIEKLSKTVKQLNPEKIGLNFSEEEGVADGLTHGLKKIFDRAVGPEYSTRVVSAEKIIISLWNRKVREEIHLIEKSARKSEEITIEALEKVKPGVTTARDIFNYIRKRVKEEGMEPGWQEWWCPTVTVGTFRLGKPPSDKVVERGDLIVINSGFLVEGYMSDINKVAYVLKNGEEKPPELIRKMFDTCLKATEAAEAKIKPGATGYEVDKAARDVVVKNGFNEYGHATGHTTGVWVHGLGIILGPPWKSYGKKIHMKIHEDDIYAVEPSITAYSEEHGGNLRIHFQEMVIVEKFGARYLNNPVKKIMLIK